ncbi:MAG: CPBP family intramembrane glutamic endopeptidase [Pseudomonadota bacterium]
MNLSPGISPQLGYHRVLRPGRWLPARAVGWMATLIFAIVLAFGPGMEALSHALPDQPMPQFMAHAAGACIVLASYLLLVRLGEARAPVELDLRAAPAGLLAGIVLGLALFSLVMLLLVLSGAYHVDYSGAASAWQGAGLALESGVFEEVLVRGVILRVAWRAFGPWVAFIVSALLFGAGHAANPGATVFTVACVAIEAGVMLGAFYALTGRLWLSIGVHAGWNFTQGYLFGANVSGSNFGKALARSVAEPRLPDWLTGGAFGPEASLPCLVVCVAVGAVVLWLALRAGRFAATTRSPPVG